MRRTQTLLVSLLLVLLIAAQLSALQSDPVTYNTITTQTTVLYDGASGGTPDEQGFTFFAFGAAAVQDYRDGSTMLDTTGETADVAGYLSQQEFPLDRHLGYKLNFTVQVMEEVHAIKHRAGFSILVTSDDLLGLEIAFWPNEIWVQSGSEQGKIFHHAESAVFDTTAGLVPYELSVLGDTYTLSASGTPLLSGVLRDYTAFDGFPDPYESPGVIFLGDNTKRGAAETVINYIALETNMPAAAMPTATIEPSLTPTTEPSPTATPEPSLTPVPTATVEPTKTETPTPPATATVQPTSPQTPEPQATPEATSPPPGWFDQFLAFLQNVFSGSDQ